MLIVRLIIAEIQKAFCILSRYLFGSTIVIVVMALLFVGIFETTLEISSVEKLTIDQTRLVAQRFVLWTVMIMGFSSVAGAVRDETHSGFIEVVWMGAFHPTTVILVRSCISHIISISMSLLIAFILSWIYQINNFFSVHFFLAVLIIGIVSIGFSLVFSAGVILFKDTGPLVTLFQFILLPFFLSFQADQNALMPILPGFSSLLILERGHVFGGGFVIGELAPLFWFAIGYLCLRMSVRYSRKKGTIYEY